MIARCCADKVAPALSNQQPSKSAHQPEDVLLAEQRQRLEHTGLLGQAGSPLLCTCRHLGVWRVIVNVTNT